MAMALVSMPTARAQGRYAGVVEQILDAWKTADVICLGEDHDRVYDNDLRIALVRHPAFPRAVRAIVVEMANPVHQDELDRFILDLAKFTFGQLYDAIVYHGDVPDAVVGPDMVAFRASMGPELDRRAQILGEAVKLRQQRP
jgi:hypothetical protein